MLLTRKTAAPVIGGRLSGHFAFHLTFDDGSYEKPYPETGISLMEKLFKMRRVEGLKTNLIVAELPSKVVDPGEVFEFLSQAKGNGFYIQVRWPGDTALPNAAPFSNEVVANVTNPSWWNFNANEIHYRPVWGDQVPLEPALSDWNALYSAKYVVVPHNKVQPEHLVRFITEVQYQWGLIQSPSRTYQLEIG